MLKLNVKKWWNSCVGIDYQLNFDQYFMQKCKSASGSVLFNWAKQTHKIDTFISPIFKYCPFV